MDQIDQPNVLDNFAKRKFREMWRQFAWLNWCHVKQTIYYYSPNYDNFLQKLAEIMKNKVIEKIKMYGFRDILVLNENFILIFIICINLFISVFPLRNV